MTCGDILESCYQNIPPVLPPIQPIIQPIIQTTTQTPIQHIIQNPIQALQLPQIRKRQKRQIFGF